MGLETLVLCSMFGWDHVTQGLVQLGFSLLDGFGPKPGPFGKTAEGCGSVAARTPAQQACKLGRQVLLQGFKVILLLNSSATKLIINSTLTRGFCVFLP